MKFQKVWICFLFFSVIILGLTSCKKNSNPEYSIVGNELTDNRDGQKYRIVDIGGKIWMADNYNYNISGSKYYNDVQSKTFGRLYNWDQINAPNFTPKGWRVPNLKDYNDLILALGSDINSVGGKMKTIGTLNWITPNTGASNSSGFNGLPGGCFVNNSNGVTGYNYQSYVGLWWILEERTSSYAYSFRLYYNNAVSEINPTGWKPDFYSVRLVKE